MILDDHASLRDHSSEPRGEAIWEYIVDTLDPVVRDTLIGDDNYFYLLCLQGRYTQRLVPELANNMKKVKKEEDADPRAP